MNHLSPFFIKPVSFIQWVNELIHVGYKGTGNNADCFAYLPLTFLLFVDPFQSAFELTFYDLFLLETNRCIFTSN